MPRKKQQSYGEMSRLMGELQEQMEQEKKRMAGVLANALLDAGAVDGLGDLSDGDLRRVASLMAGNVNEYVERMQADKKQKKDAAAEQVPETNPPAEVQEAFTRAVPTSSFGTPQE